MNSSLPSGHEPEGVAASELKVTVSFIFHVDERIVPRKLQVSCPAGATVQDLIEILSGIYGESLRDSLNQPSLMAIIDGVQKGRIFRDVVLGAAGEKNIEIVFMIFNMHGG
jgi:hypothetical protein